MFQLTVTQHQIRSSNDRALDDIAGKPACLRSKAAKLVTAFPLWLLKNNHTSFTLIKMKFLLPLFLLPLLYTSTSTISHLVHLLSSLSLGLIIPCLPLSSFLHVLLFLSLSLCHLAQARSSPFAMSHLSRFIRRHVPHDGRILLGKMKGSIRLQYVATLLT